MDPWQIVAALATAFGSVAAFLFREYQKAITERVKAVEAAAADDRAQRDEALRLLDLSLQNNRDAIAAWGKRDDTDAARRRRSD